MLQRTGQDRAISSSKALFSKIVYNIISTRLCFSRLVEVISAQGLRQTGQDSVVLDTLHQELMKKFRNSDRCKNSCSYETTDIFGAFYCIRFLEEQSIIKYCSGFGFLIKPTCIAISNHSIVDFSVFHWIRHLIVHFIV